MEPHLPANVSAPAGRVPLAILGPAPTDRLAAAGKSIGFAHHARVSCSDEAPGSSRSATFDSIKALAETDFRGDLAKFDRPTLIVHGDDDQVVRIDVAGRATNKLVSHAVLKVYAGAPRGLPDTHQQQPNKDMVEFLRS